MQDHLEQFKALQLCAGLDEPTICQIARHCRIEHHHSGSQIITRDDVAGDFVLILAGSVRVYDSTESGREITYAEIPSGGHVGQLAAVDGGPRSANVAAATNCVIARLSSQNFRKLLRQSPELAFGLLLDFAAIIRQADTRITELCTTGAVERLCRKLLERANPCPHSGHWIIEDVPTQQLLASDIGSTRETVAKTMAAFKHDGLLRRAGRKIYIDDVKKLQLLARISPNITAA